MLTYSVELIKTKSSKMKTKGIPIRDDHNNILPTYQPGKIYTATREINIIDPNKKK